MPHFSKEEYYKLQSLLCKTKLPNFTWANLLDLPSQVDGSYDLMLFSNIYDYLGMDAFEYKEFLKQFKASIIQAHYSWQWNSKVEELCNLGFYAHTFLSTQMENSDTNCVISLKKTKQIVFQMRCKICLTFTNDSNDRNNLRIVSRVVEY